MLDEIFKRKLALAELMTIAMHLFLANFKSICKVVFTLFLSLSILHVLILDRVSDSVLLMTQLAQSGVTSANMPAYVDSFILYLGNTLLQATVLLFLEPVGIIAIAKIGKGYIQGEPISVKDAIGEAMGCLWATITTGIPYWFAIFFGTLLFIIPGIYLGGIWVFYIYAIGLRGERGFGALGYSKKLVQGRWWQTFGTMVVVSIITSGMNWIFSGVYIFGADNILVMILYYTLTYFSASFMYLLMTTFFLNREHIILGKLRDQPVAIIEDNVL